jgi:hypothetical protein
VIGGRRRRERFGDALAFPPRLLTLDRATGAPAGVAWELATAREGPPFTRAAGPEPTTVCAFAPTGNEALIHTPWGVPPDKRGI